MEDSSSDRPAKRSRLSRRRRRPLERTDPLVVNSVQGSSYAAAPPPVAGAEAKPKAANFPASLLRIGTWEYVRKYSNDLMSKCYFCRKKLVWEILYNDNLKKKIEFPWSDITALRVTFFDNDSGTLDVALAKPPMFYKEHNPQPRKHTSWKACADFTDNQATTHRLHRLEYSDGFELSKTFHRLISHDPLLNSLSCQQDSPYWSPQYARFDQGDPEIPANSSTHDASRVDVHPGVTSLSSSRPATLLPESYQNDVAESSGWGGVLSFSHEQGFPYMLSGNDAAAARSTDYFGNITTEEGGLGMDEHSQYIDAIINSLDHPYMASHLEGATDGLEFAPPIYRPPPPPPAPSGGGGGGASCSSGYPHPFSDDVYHPCHAATFPATANSGQESGRVGGLLKNNDRGGGGGEASSVMEDGLLQMIPKAAAAAAAATVPATANSGQESGRVGGLLKNNDRGGGGGGGASSVMEDGLLQMIPKAAAAAAANTAAAKAASAAGDEDDFCKDLFNFSDFEGSL